MDSREENKQTNKTETLIKTENELVVARGIGFGWMGEIDERD